MLNHDNLTWLSHVLATHMNVQEGKDVFVSYLPMSHVAAQVSFRLLFNFLVSAKTRKKKRNKQHQICLFVVAFVGNRSVLPAVVRRHRVLRPTRRP